MVFLVVFLTGIFVATVRLTVGAERIVLGQGPLGWPSRTAAVSLVADAYAANLTRAQVFGVGVAWHWRTARMTVRSGPTLTVALTTGEYIRVSTPDPSAAIAVIRPGQLGPPPLKPTER